MDCNRIPVPGLWDDATQANYQQYRLHIEFCSACRARVLKEAPEKLLFDLQEDPLPEEFWLGFWNSVDRKRPAPELPTNQVPYSVARWAAVFVFGFLILLYGRNLPESEPVRQLRTSAYPVVEIVGNPDAHYYIFQTSDEQKVVMVFDPGMEF